MDKQPDLTRTNILHRTPWRPPTAVGGEGIYIQLENGPKIIDGVGGAAVACLGMGNTKVTKAITEQLGKLACKSADHPWPGRSSGTDSFFIISPPHRSIMIQTQTYTTVN